MDIYDMIVEADQDFGVPMLVDPKAGTVVHDFDRSITEENLHIDLNPDGMVPPGSLWSNIHETFEFDLRRAFEPAEFMTASTWRYWLNEYVADGKPFVLQTFVIDGMPPEENAESVGIGWGFAVKMVE